MTPEILSLHQVGSIILLISTVVGAVVGYGVLRLRNTAFSLMLLVPAVAALVYALMSLGVGFVSGGEYMVNTLRYLDWFITTPILLYILTYAAITDKTKRHKTFMLLLIADVVMLAAGLGAELYPGISKVILFAISTIAYIAMLYIVLEVLMGLRKQDFSDKERRIALTMAWAIIGLWSVYPFIWVFGTQGVAAIGLWSETVAYMVLDVTTKTGFVFLLSWFLTQRLERIKESA